MIVVRANETCHIVQTETIYADGDSLIYNSNKLVTISSGFLSIKSVLDVTICDGNNSNMNILKC